MNERSYGILFCLGYFLYPTCHYQEGKRYFLIAFLGGALTAGHCGVNFVISGMSRGKILGPWVVQKFPADIPVALVKVKESKGCLSLYFFSGTNLIACLCHHTHSCCCYFYIIIVVIVWLVRYISDSGPSGSLTTINPQLVLPRPLTPFQTMVHRPSGIGSSVSTPSDCTMTTILSLLFHVYINICTTGLQNPSFLLCKTELAALIFREPRYVLSKCLLYCENVKNPLNVLFSIFYQILSYCKNLQFLLFQGKKKDNKDNAVFSWKQAPQAAVFI